MEKLFLMWLMFRKKLKMNGIIGIFWKIAAPHLPCMLCSLFYQRMSVPKVDDFYRGREVSPGFPCTPRWILKGFDLGSFFLDVLRQRKSFKDLELDFYWLKPTPLRLPIRRFQTCMPVKSKVTNRVEGHSAIRVKSNELAIGAVEAGRSTNSWPVRLTVEV